MEDISELILILLLEFVILINILFGNNKKYRKIKSKLLFIKREPI